MPYVNVEEKRRYQRKWVAQRRAEWFADKVCDTCGGHENLELHHPDAMSKISHRIWSWSAERRANELAKCVVRCDPCHNEHHARLLCGTDAAYQRGCQYDLCRIAHRGHVYAWRLGYRAA